jgi:hypothetical protein
LSKAGAGYLESCTTTTECVCVCVCVPEGLQRSRALAGLRLASSARHHGRAAQRGRGCDVSTLLQAEVEELRRAAENDRVFASFTRAEAAAGGGGGGGGPTTTSVDMQDTVVHLELQVRTTLPSPWPPPSLQSLAVCIHLCALARLAALNRPTGRCGVADR